MPLPYLRIAAAGLLVGAVACGSVNSVRLRGRSPSGDLAPRPGTIAGDLGGPTSEPTARTPDIGTMPDLAGGSRYPGSRQVCRASAVPRGWIAVAYVSSAGQCPARSGADSTATAAVLMRYADEALGMELDVCADQVIPRGWALAREEANDANQCPGAARDDKPTTKRIRRIR
jgi:hypothetical protein